MPDNSVNMAELGAAIAKHLEGFKVEPSDPEAFDPRGHVVLRHEDGRRFGIHKYANQERAEVWPYWPGERDDSYGTECPRPTFNPARPPEAIAKDIARRFLPTFTTEWNKVAERAERRKANEAAQDARATRLAAILKTTYLAYDQSTHSRRRDAGEVRTRQAGWGSFKVFLGGKDVTIELHSVPVELAEDIARLIARKATSK